MADQIKMGDASPDDIYHAVGKALTQWELMEATLADIFGVLIGGENDGAIRAYGMLNGFGMRQSMLAEVHRSYEGKFADQFAPLTALLRRAGELVGQRNEIAHGAVGHVTVQNGPHGFFLRAAPYNSKKQMSQKDRVEAFNAAVSNGTFGQGTAYLIDTRGYHLTADEIHERGGAFADLNRQLLDLYRSTF